jgi:hypothetical protein
MQCSSGNNEIRDQGHSNLDKLFMLKMPHVFYVMGVNEDMVHIFFQCDFIQNLWWKHNHEWIWVLKKRTQNNLLFLLFLEALGYGTTQIK